MKLLFILLLGLGFTQTDSITKIHKTDILEFHSSKDYDSFIHSNNNFKIDTSIQDVRDRCIILNLEVTPLTDLDGDGIDDPCYEDNTGEFSHYFLLTWVADCPVTDIYWGVDSPYENGGYFGSFPSPTLLFYGFGPDEAYQFVVANTNEDPVVESNIYQSEATNSDCGVSCPEYMINDCFNTAHCCYESLLGNGICNNEFVGTGNPNQCDFTCYDDDGGDCEEVPGVPGDIDFNNELNVNDIIIMIQVILGNYVFTDAQMESADYNGDSQLNIIDIIFLIDIILGNND